MSSWRTRRANRQKFAAASFAWTASSRAATLLPDQARLGTQFKTQLADAVAARQRFFAAIDENLKSVARRDLSRM